jgi:hypothetical protein
VLKQPKRRIPKALVYLLIGLGFYLGACYLLAGRYVEPARYTELKPAHFEALTLGNTAVWATPGWEKGRALYVFAHGMGGQRNDFVDTMDALAEDGYGCLTVSMPGHGENSESRIGFGKFEAETLISVVSELKTRYPDLSIYLVGLSMGGSAAWLASEKVEIDGIATEGAYAVFTEAMDTWFDQKLPFGRFILRPIVWFGSAKVGINPSKIRPIDAAKKWDRTKPAVILHAEADDLIGRSHADRFVEASGAKLIVLEGASHAQGQNSDHDLYLQSLRSLAKQVR